MFAVKFTQKILCTSQMLIWFQNAHVKIERLTIFKKYIHAYSNDRNGLKEARTFKGEN